VECLHQNSSETCNTLHRSTRNLLIQIFPNPDQDLVPYTRSYNITNAALGIKVKPVGNLLITANVTLKLNDGGLRAKAVPLVAASYTF
jgi:hypothetical protein